MCIGVQFSDEVWQQFPKRRLQYSTVPDRQGCSFFRASVELDWNQKFETRKLELSSSSPHHFQTHSNPMTAVTKVRTWVASTPHGRSVSDDDDDRDGSQNELSWENFTLQARPRIITSKVSIRVPFLKDEVLRLVKTAQVPTPSQKSDLVRLLFQTIPRYEDNSSRTAALDVLEALIRRPDQANGDMSASAKPNLMSTIIKWISHESGRLCENPQGVPAGAGSTRLAILVWTCHLLGMLCSAWHPDDKEKADDASILLQTLGQLLDSMEETSTNRAVCRKSAVVITRRTIRKVSCVCLSQFLSYFVMN